MKQMTLRLPDDLHAALKALAESEQRSLHGQIMHLVLRAVAEQGGTSEHAIPPPPEDGGPLAQT